jgi:hypothetical protein
LGIAYFTQDENRINLRTREKAEPREILFVLPPDRRLLVTEGPAFS